MRLLLITLLLASSLSLNAKPSEWTDIQGSSFKGEPLQVLGPMALFRTSFPAGVKWVLLRTLSVETVQRFYREVKLTDPALRWADAKAEATGPLVGRASHMDANGKLEKADFTKVAEPQLLVVLYGPRGWGDSVTLARAPQGVYAHLQALRPGQVEFVFAGDKSVISWTRMPWYTAGADELAEMRPLSRYAPKEDALMVLMTRSGDVLMSGSGENYGTVTKFLDAVCDVLWKIDPTNPEYWLDRLYYLMAVRPLEHAQDTSAPVLIGIPFNPGALRSHGISRITATLHVEASGKTARVELPQDTPIPETMRGQITEALMHCHFAPAIDHGAAVASTYEFSYDLASENHQSATERAWYSGKARAEIPISSWLVLRPIPVPPEEFTSSGSDVDHVDAAGVVVMKSVAVSSGISKKAQLNAFNSNWFDAAGAGSIQPSEGKALDIDGKFVKWQKMIPDGGYVNLAEGFPNCDYSVGYAWTAVDAPKEMDAFLGVGSDDGIKIWVNGALVDDKWIQRECKLDEDIIPLHLNQGRNNILIKIQNVKGEWGFMCRLRSRER